MSDDIKLPPLPTVDIDGAIRPQVWFTLKDLESYARAAVLVEREGRPSNGVMQMYLTSLCVLVESFAEAADIDLDDTEMKVRADGNVVASKTVQEILDAAMKIAEAQRAKETTNGTR